MRPSTDTPMGNLTRTLIVLYLPSLLRVFVAFKSSFSLLSLGSERVKSRCWWASGREAAQSVCTLPSAWPLATLLAGPFPARLGSAILLIPLLLFLSSSAASKLSSPPFSPTPPNNLCLSDPSVSSALYLSDQLGAGLLVNFLWRRRGSPEVISHGLVEPCTIMGKLSSKNSPGQRAHSFCLHRKKPQRLGE